MLNPNREHCSLFWRIQGWRTFGFAVFGAMWALLIRHTEEGRISAITDSFVATTTIFGYLACRGWRSWRLFRERH